jgi:hypothetical protein
MILQVEGIRKDFAIFLASKDLFLFIQIAFLLLLLLPDVFKANLDSNNLSHVCLVTVDILCGLLQNHLEVILILLFYFLFNVLFEDLFEKII